MYWRLLWGLRGFLKDPVTLQESRKIIECRLNDREKNLLNIVRRAIYENERSPYLKLLKFAGCEYGDFENMVQVKGIEPTLRKLCEEGVYLRIEEFKGRKEVVRGVKIFKFKVSDFDNPLLLRHLETTSGGSRGVPVRTLYDFDHLASGRAVYHICLLDAFQALDIPTTLWAPTLPGWGSLHVLGFAKVNKPVAKWFSPVSESSYRPSLKSRVAQKYITYLGRLWGARLPTPEYVSLDKAWRIAQYIAETIKTNGGCYMHTAVSNAVRICKAAKEKNLDISGVKFVVSSEPVTEAKRLEIESMGASISSLYVFIEGGWVGLGCFHPTVSDDVHLLKDSIALIQHNREVSHAGLSVNAFLFTTLLLSSPKILLNVESGDFGIIEHRSCGCYFDKLNFGDHIYNIRSFEKLNAQGMTFVGTDLVKILEELLPTKFGGSSIDYQMIEEEDQDGYTRMSVVVSPDVGEIDESEVIRTILRELGKGNDTQRMMADIWSQSTTLRLKRMYPLTTTMGKLLPLHIQKGK